MDAQTTLKAKIADADAIGGRWLADGNDAAERGNHARAQKCYDKAQYWLDRSNALRDKLWLLRHASESN